ncbi:right-handed parallel beta-helix repeat-containing protein [Roseomonas elaeocarpi]|uniref:Nitrous oxide reductase family maturation protein NosD n=1 Tax=Roseomonas elaeocarpi TaxID=907779 RepID=A0ABV6JLN6_9PROT
MPSRAEAVRSLLVLFWTAAVPIMVTAAGAAEAPAEAPPASVTSLTAFHVSPDGDDAAEGSAAHPFATLNRAAEALRGSPVRVVYVAAGTYRPTVSLRLGREHSGVAILAAPEQRPVIEGACLGENSLILLDGADGVTIAGFHFVDSSAEGSLRLRHANRNRVLANRFSRTGTAIVLDASSRNTVSGNWIERSAQSAIEAKDGSDQNLFDSNRVDGTGAPETTGGGFFLHGVNNNRVAHNLVENTRGMGIGVLSWDAATTNIGNVIAYNVVRRANQDAVDSGAIYMLGRSQVDTRARIEGNLVDGAGRPDQHTIGIYLDDSTSGVDVLGNVVRDTGRHAVQIHGGDDNLVTSNLLDLGSSNASAVLFQAAPADTAPANTMRNNVVSGNIIYSASAAPVSFDWIDGGVPDIHGNLYVNPYGAFTSYGPTSDTNPLSGDPGFADPGAGDYSMRERSTAALIGFRGLDLALVGPRRDAAWWSGVQESMQPAADVAGRQCG